MSAAGDVLIFVSPLWTEKTLQLVRWLKAKNFDVNERAVDVIVKPEMIPVASFGLLRAWNRLNKYSGEKTFNDFCADILIGNLARFVIVHGITDHDALSDLNTVLSRGVTSFSALYLDREDVVIISKAEEKMLFLPKPVVL